VCRLEHTTFARHLVEDLALARVGDVLAEHHHYGIALHLVVQRPVNRRHHRDGIALR
jgi:hypothetical protein